MALSTVFLGIGEWEKSSKLMRYKSARNMAALLDEASFLEKFEAQFEEVEQGSIGAATRFRDLPEWSSMQSLVVIASFDWEYGVTITADELREAETVGDLFKIVKGKVT